METVCVQGLGFVGTAMALAIASARSDEGNPVFDVIGVELDTPEGRAKVESINSERLPVESADPKMQAAFEEARRVGNLKATTDAAAYESAAVVMVDIHLDLGFDGGGSPTVDFTGLRSAIATIAARMPEGSLVIVETTVPPGCCEKVIAPEIDEIVAERGLAPGSIQLAHSYERVMPGADYLDSITDFWRVYSGITPAAADACEAFLSQVVNVEDYPLTRLDSTTASEAAKLLENSYRAMTIAFMEEWGRFAEEAGIDIFAVIDAIRRRPTHSNMRQPGFGVGGYCLPKDPLFPGFGARELLGIEGAEFAFSEMAVKTNHRMPMVTVERLDKLLGGLAGKRILLMGVAYREGVADTRFSPSEQFVEAVRNRGGEVVAYDPIVTDEPWVESTMPGPAGFDAVVFAVGHPELSGLDLIAWLDDADGEIVVVDASRVFDAEVLRRAGERGATVWAIGRGAVEAGVRV